MFRGFIALLLTLLFGLPTAAGAVVHRCGGEIVAHCACDHGAELRAEPEICCSEQSIPAGAGFVLGEHGAPVLLEPADRLVLPKRSIPVAAPYMVDARGVAPPVRGPPKIPIFLLNRVFLA